LDPPPRIGTQCINTKLINLLLVKLNLVFLTKEVDLAPKTEGMWESFRIQLVK
jgi:hypothetical protein